MLTIIQSCTVHSEHVAILDWCLVQDSNILSIEIFVTKVKLLLSGSEPREPVLDLELDRGLVQEGFGLKGFCNG